MKKRRFFGKKNMVAAIFICILLMLSIHMVYAGESNAVPTVTPEATPTVTPTVIPEATPTVTPTVTPEATPTVTPTVTPEATPTVTPTATPEATPTVTPTATPIPTPTVKPEVKKGLKYENKQYRYYVNGKLLVDKWKTINGRRYYFRKNGNAAKGGALLINNKYYVFNMKAQLLNPKKTSLITVGDNKYYVNTKGNPVPGWVIIGSKAYYILKTGRAAADKTVEGIKLNKSGYAGNTDQVRCKLEARKFIKLHAGNKKTNREKFRACFNYIVAYQRYRPGHNPKGYPNKNWQYTGAVDMFTSSLSGNCYGFACTVAAVAKELGYQPYIITITADHGFVMIDGKYYDNMGALFGASYHRPYTIKQKIKF